MTGLFIEQDQLLLTWSWSSWSCAVAVGLSVIGTSNFHPTVSKVRVTEECLGLSYSIGFVRTCLLRCSVGAYLVSKRDGLVNNKADNGNDHASTELAESIILLLDVRVRVGKRKLCGTSAPSSVTR